MQEENKTVAKHTRDEPYVYPPKRILQKEYFDKAIEEISASISKDISTLCTIRKFDKRYSNCKGRLNKKLGIGFSSTTDPKPDLETSRVQKLELNI